LQVRREAK